ncbi:hypothetical protein CJO09_03895 [Neopusillimonas maritima]|uniref:Flagellar protein FliT n=1 Tax=Neopusillimonas maritima TaxID=2026239 RepID=A0ABX9N247_9BURK|nr:hypothetical protein CJO09_03895 [Neopusillimonas maritima]
MMRALELQQLMVASDAARLGATSNSECAALFYSICQEADVLQNMAALPSVSPEYRAALERVASHIRTISRMGARQASASAEQIRQALGYLKATSGSDHD